MQLESNRSGSMGKRGAVQSPKPKAKPKAKAKPTANAKGKAKAVPKATAPPPPLPNDGQSQSQNVDVVDSSDSSSFDAAAVRQRTPRTRKVRKTVTQSGGNSPQSMKCQPLSESGKRFWEDQFKVKTEPPPEPLPATVASDNENGPSASGSLHACFQA